MARPLFQKYLDRCQERGQAFRLPSDDGTVARLITRTEQTDALTEDATLGEKHSGGRDAAPAEEHKHGSPLVAVIA